LPNQDFIRQLPGSEVQLGQPVNLWKRFHIDLPLLGLLLMLTIFGLVVLYSGGGQKLYYIKRQATSFGIAYFLMFVIAQMDIHILKRWAPIVYVCGVVLLMAVLLFGEGAKGAQRWLNLPGLPRFQPSEIMKLILPIVVATFLDGKPLPPKFGHVIATLVIIFFPTILILKQPDLGTAILILVPGMTVLFLSGLHWYYLAACIVVALPTGPIFWFYVLQDYQKKRILTLFDPQADVFGAGWNIFQSMTAIGSGGVHGKGWLKGTQSQLDFLPESQTDFIIAVLAEEKGLLGVVSLLIIYLLIVMRGFYIGLQAQETFGRLLAGSITLTFFVYVVVNMLMVSGLIPVVGVPLPLVSHGGTAIVSLMCGFGILMAISTENKKLSL